MQTDGFSGVTTANERTQGNDLPTGPVVVLGDLMLDLYLFGSVDRISPEAPVPVIHLTSQDERAGGAANVALNISAIGGTASLLGIVGDDPEANRLEQILTDAGVSVEFLRSPGVRTTTKTRVLSGKHHQFLRIDREDRGAFPRALEEQLMHRLEVQLDSAKALVLSDYGKGCLSDFILEQSIAIARKKGIPVLVDPKRADFSAYAGATYIKPNLKELATASGMALGSSSFDAIEEAARRLCNLTGSNLLVTMSEKGMALFPASGAAPTYQSVTAQEVFDVSGAGDTVIGVFSALLAGGTAVERALHLANLAAGVVVSKVGTATLTATELLDALRQETIASRKKRPPGQVQDWASILDQRGEWRKQGLTVGFTNGCFDLLHPGHIALLRQSASHCDRLVIGLNSDASVQRLKGPSRPVQHEAARAAVLSALGDVDAVVIFGEDTPLDLITQLEPDVLCKGADYTEDAIVGADFVKARGGRVIRIPLVEGQSTSALVRRSQEHSA